MWNSKHTLLFYTVLSMTRSMGSETQLHSKIEKYADRIYRRSMEKNDVELQAHFIALHRVIDPMR